MVTISGPPATLNALFQESEFFGKRKTVTLDVFGPFHAPHLYNDVDVEEVLHSIAETNIRLASPSTRVVSDVTETSPDLCLEQSIRGVVRDILIQSLSFDRILSALISETRKSGKKVCKISSVGPSNAASSVVSALRART